MTLSAVSGRSDIPETEFPDYVRLMHQDRDRKLEQEFKVQNHSLNFGYYLWVATM